MGSRTISVSDEAYARLKALKRPGESFSDVINRLTNRKRLSELAGTLSEEDAKALEWVIKEIRAKSKARLDRTIKELAK